MICQKICIRSFFKIRSYAFLVYTLQFTLLTSIYIYIYIITRFSLKGVLWVKGSWAARRAHARAKKASFKRPAAALPDSGYSWVYHRLTSQIHKFMIHSHQTNCTTKKQIDKHDIYIYHKHHLTSHHFTYCNVIK